MTAKTTPLYFQKQIIEMFVSGPLPIYEIYHQATLQTNLFVCCLYKYREGIGQWTKNKLFSFLNIKFCLVASKDLIKKLVVEC